MEKTINQAIKDLVEYGVRAGLLEETDRIYVTNQILAKLEIEEYEEPSHVQNLNLEEILKVLLDFACEKGLVENSVVYRDLFDAKLMNCLMMRPSEIQKKFWELYQEDPKKATNYFYKLSQDSDYIRRYRIQKDKKWTVDTEYGTLEDRKSVV